MGGRESVYQLIGNRFSVNQFAGLFAEKLINPSGADGLFFGNPHQLVVQIMSIAVVVIYSFAVTFILLKLIELIMGLRVSEEDEMVGLDLSQHEESGYTL